jgi:transglutaminase-like putative cysteine protease
MNTPLWLQAAGLVLWGFASEQGVVGALLAVARLLAPASGVRLNLADRDLNRAVDLSVLAVVLTIAGFLMAQGLPKGLLVATGWLPVALFPLLLIDALSETPLRLRHLAVTLRRSTHPDADQTVQLGASYLAMTLLSAAVLAKPSPWFFWALAGLVLAWLFLARPAHLATGRAAFVFATFIAVGGGYGASMGLQRAQVALQEWVVDAMVNTDTDPSQSQTRIGDLGRVKLSDRIAWRVEQTPPVVVPLLLRSGVFTRFANGTWVARRDAFAPAPAAPVGALRRLTLHGESSKGATILPLPIDGGQIGGEAGTIQRNAYGVVRVNDAPARLDVTVGNSSIVAPIAPESEDLALPPGFLDLMQRLPELKALAQGSEHERLAGVESWFAAHFRYTLFLGDEEHGRRDLERFLLTDRAGHCEYFATSTVLLLRTLGIPARYVTGYSVQEYSRLEKAFVVRSRHAHAWAEAYIEGKWVPVDTTPSTWLTIEENAAPFWQPVPDFISFAWRRLGEFRRSMAASEHLVGVWGLGALFVVLLARFAFKHVKRVGKPRRDKVSASDTAYEPASNELQSFHVLEKELEALGLGRRVAETPRAWIVRVDREGTSVLDEPRIAKAHDLIESLYRNRYGFIPAE